MTKRSLDFKSGLLGLILGIIIDLIIIALQSFVLNKTIILSFSESGFIFLVPPVILAGVGFVIGHKFREKNELIEEGQVQMQNKISDIKLALDELSKSEDVSVFDGLNLDDEIKTTLSDFKSRMNNKEAEEEKRAWVSEGIAKFSEILRSDRNKGNELYDLIISNLVKYLSANQAGLFLVKDGVIVLEACYAYNRKKFLENRIEPGQGLIGQCYLEKEKIVLSDIPEGYINITSGMGEATPKKLVVFPLKIEDEVIGVLEIASFSNFEDRHFELLERIGEITASTISGIQVSQNTEKLLSESREQTEQLRSQEEEMRQNMEELAATQEDTKRKEQELQRVLSELKTKEIRQRLSEISISVESIIENSRKELVFLQSTPPVSGIFRAQANDGIDPMDGSTEEVWVSRLNVILENLMMSKELYERVVVVGLESKLITGLEFDGMSVSPISSLEDDHQVSNNLVKGQVHTNNPTKSNGSGFRIDMYIPIYLDNKEKGYMQLSTLGSPITEVLKSKEDEGNHYSLSDGFGNQLYSKILGSPQLSNDSMEVVLNEVHNYSVKIVHSTR